MIYNKKMRIIEKNRPKLVFKLFFLFYALIIPIVSFAIGQNPPCDPGKICNPLGDTGPASIQEFIKTLLTGVLKIGIPIVALAIIYCGFLFVAARGNSEKLTKAKGALLYTLIGAAILLGSWAIANLISSTVLAL